MQPQHENTTIERYTIDNHTIRYVDIGNTDAPMVILLHGAPGGISTWYSFLQNTAVLDTFRFLVVDRPGYGHSG